MRPLYYMMFFLLVIAGCRKDKINETIITDTFTPEKQYELLITGLVVDENGDPLTDATIYADIFERQSDEFGAFSIENLKVGSSGTYIKVVKEGYHLGGARIYADDATDQFVKIVLLKSEKTGTVSGLAGGGVVTLDGNSVNFPANAFIKNGNPYTGDVDVHMRWLDPSDERIYQLMPGDLSGIGLDEEVVSLQTFGMMAVDIYSTSGERLQIAPGKSAKLNFKVPESLLSEAPLSIPIWSFHEQKGIWVEETTADLVNGFYETEVSHFSWWNCDYPGPGVNLCVEVLDERTGAKLRNVRVEICTPARGRCGSVYTDNNGVACGKVLKDAPLNLRIFDACGNVAGELVIGPFSAPNNRIQVIIVLNSAELVGIKGQVMNCSNQPISGASIYISTQNERIALQTNPGGRYSTSVLVCQSSQEVMIDAFDKVNLLKSDTMFTVNPGDPDHDVDFTLCDNVDEFLSVTIDGVQQVLVFDVKAIAGRTETVVLGRETQNWNTELLGINGFSVGSFTGNYRGSGNNVFVDTNAVNFVIDEYGDIGEFVGGSFSATGIQGENVTGSFRALRTR